MTQLSLMWQQAPMANYMRCPCMVSLSALTTVLKLALLHIDRLRMFVSQPIRRLKWMQPEEKHQCRYSQ